MDERGFVGPNCLNTLDPYTVMGRTALDLARDACQDKKLASYGLIEYYGMKMRGMSNADRYRQGTMWLLETAELSNFAFFDLPPDARELATSPQESTTEEQRTTRTWELTTGTSELTTRISELTTRSSELTVRTSELTTRKSELTTRTFEMTTRTLERHFRQPCMSRAIWLLSSGIRRFRHRFACSPASVQ